MAAPTNELLLAREHRRMLQETERLNRDNEERLRRESYLSPAARAALQRARATADDIRAREAERVARRRAAEENGPITTRNNAGRISKKRNFKKYHKGTPKKVTGKNKKRRLSKSKRTRKY